MRGEPAAAEADVTLHQPEAVFTQPTPVLSLRSDLRSLSLSCQPLPTPAGLQRLHSADLGEPPGEAGAAVSPAGDTDPSLAAATVKNSFYPVESGRRCWQARDSICVPGFDPGLNMMTGITPINPMIPGLGLVPPPPTEVAVVKEIIHCKSCTLFPQNPNLPPPSTRERPPGCKTVFVGGLPENATEEIIQEVFEQCGDITAIRKSKKNFCHIRFAEEFMVDKAIYLSGYRMRLGSSTDKKDSGRLHVDFAQARDDFYEWECKQRMRAREERHRRKLEEDRLRPPSPPPIMHYSEHEAALLAEKLKDDSKFSEAITVLLSWIERGEVNRRSANQFYSMVQSANSHVRRLMNEKATHEQEMEEAKENFKNALTGILTQSMMGFLMLDLGVEHPATGSSEDHRLLPVEPVSICTTSHVEKQTGMSTGDPRTMHRG
ncbi:hypothetical protein J1605_007038 [Eschrichtius robustus]|uniref:RRM domain-containing protein n=1 Tax=Eschrichtius robustus TaxID=9764 RepID=A0AB34GY56_ESCRO|nr:hypothetical protein J1605_007038 [Eschrichtius robustus]